MLHRVNLSECENRENAVLTQTLNKPTLVNSSFSWFAQSREGKKRWNGVLLGVFSKSRKKKIWHGPGVGCLGCLGVVRCHRSRFDLLKRHAIVLGGHGRTRWRRWNAARTTPSSWGQDWLPNTAVTAVLLLLCFYILSIILSLLFLQMFAVMFLEQLILHDFDSDSANCLQALPVFRCPESAPLSIKQNRHLKSQLTDPNSSRTSSTLQETPKLPRDDASTSRSREENSSFLVLKSTSQSNIDEKFDNS